MLKKVYDNRELSWLKFNQRVLEEAQDTAVPLLERLTFTSIFSTNLDEFFMVRVGSLHDQILLKDNTRENKTDMSAKEQIDAICVRTHELIPIKDKAYSTIMKQLSEYEVQQVDFKDLTKNEVEFLENYFLFEIKPLISPQVIDKRHPFPFLNNKDIYAIAKIESKSSVKLGLIQANGVFDRIIYLPGDKLRFMLVEDLILHFASKVFVNYHIEEKALIRVTRNADINAEEALFDFDLDFRSVMSELIKKRKKLSPVRLEISRILSDPTLDELCSRLEISREQIFLEKAPLDFSFVFSLQDKLSDKKELLYSNVYPQKSPSIDDSETMVKQIQRGDIMLSYPYESIKPFIRLLQEASTDPHVVSIKITLYRVAKNSKIVEMLIDAAENGKEVLVLVELRARFDEENNIGWSKRLEVAGCTVIYGPENLKVHSKLLLITRKSGNKVEYITQIGTGNYNEKTSTLYTDISIMTANKDIAIEAATVFNSLSLVNLVEHTNHLLVAPLCLQNKVLDMLEAEILISKTGSPAYFGAKLNSLSDKILIDKLIEASRAGVKIELVVRGICCIIGGVEGFTENITVTSIVGRFLEHSRIYIFGTSERQRLYISSADFMTRNTVRRVEVAAPVYDKIIRERIFEMFKIMLSDNVKARVQLPDGTYIKKQSSGASLDSQAFFYMQAYKNASLASFISTKPTKKLTLLKKLFNKWKTKKASKKK